AGSSSETPSSPALEPTRGDGDRKAVLRVTGFALLVAVAAAPVSPATAQDIVIGVVAPMTGNLAQIGKQLADGAQLATQAVNARGGIKGRNVVIRVADDQADAKVAVTVARKLAADETVVAVLGHYSTLACLAAIPIYTKARLAAITPSASSADL